MFLVAVAVGWSQTALTSTTFSAAVAVADEFVTVASASGITGRSGGTVTTMLYSGREAFRVISVSGTRVHVERGSSGSRQHAHASAATVYVGPPGAFTFNTPPVGGACTTVEQGYSPLINVGTGQHFECVSSVWKHVIRDADPVVSVNVGTAGTGVTAIEYGDGRRHITKLTFSALELDPDTAADAEAAGVLIYTLPAGATLVNSASISVGLAGSGAACDADEPDLGLGTVIASGDTAVLSGTGTFEDILSGQTANDCDGTVELKTLSQGLGVEAAGAHTVHLNVADTWADICTITATGTVWLEWTVLD